MCEALSEEKPEQHLLKRVVDLFVSRHIFYNYLLRETHIDLNAVELINDIPETLVDYLDKREKQAAVDDEELLIEEIKKLRTRIMHPRYGAKRAKDLPPEALEHLY